MNKRSVIFLVIVSVIFICVLGYFTPSVTPMNMTLNAVRVDLDGNELGTQTLVFTGSRLDYLIKPSRLDLTIPSFDEDISYIMTATYQSDYGEIVGYIRDYPPFDFQYVAYGAYLKSENSLTAGTLYFSPDMTRFAFMWPELDTYFLASVNDEYTTAELVEYFDLFFHGM